MKSTLTTFHGLLAVSAVAALAPVAHAQITGFDADFNGSAASYTDTFARFGDSAVGTTGLNWGAAVGTGGTGGLIVTEASARNVFYRPAPASNATSTFDLAAASDTFTAGIDFKWADTTSTALSVITAGFVPDNASQTALTSTGALAGSIIRNGSSTVTLRMRNGNANANAVFDFNQSAFTAGNWYRLSYEVTKSETLNTFVYTVGIFSIGANGTASPVALTVDVGGTPTAVSITGSVSNSALYADTNAFYAYDIRGGATGISHVDNFVVGSAIPEPSAFAALAGLGALTAVGLRRRRA